MSEDQATFGGGCFWCIEAFFSKLKGVTSVVSGYAGGERSEPSYEQVSTGVSGYAEVIQIEFDPAIITYRDLLEVFFAAHDPTQLNRQGADVGTQYRSIILYHSKKQKEIIKEMLQQLERQEVFSESIVTEVIPFDIFYPAEEYHQRYYQKNPKAPYCSYTIRPKLEKLTKQFGHLLRDTEF